MFVRRGKCLVLAYTPRRGLRPWGWIDGDNPIALHRLNRYYAEGDDVKRRVTVDQIPAGPSHAAAVESEVFKALHPIVAHLTVMRYDDGSPRQPGTLLVKTVGASWQITAKEPDSKAQLIVTAPTLDDALAALSLALESDQTPWQPDPWAVGMDRSKKRKGA